MYICTCSVVCIIIIRLSLFCIKEYGVSLCRVMILHLYSFLLTSTSTMATGWLPADLKKSIFKLEVVHDWSHSQSRRNDLESEFCYFNVIVITCCSQ